MHSLSVRVVALQALSCLPIALGCSDAGTAPSAAPDAAADVTDASTATRFTSSTRTLIGSRRSSRASRPRGLGLAGIEFIEDARGERYTYDLNANTHYNAALGRAIGVDGMREVARWMRRTLAA